MVLKTIGIIILLVLIGILSSPKLFKILEKKVN